MGCYNTLDTMLREIGGESRKINLRTVSHLSTNLAGRRPRVTSLMRRTPLPLRQTATQSCQDCKLIPEEDRATDIRNMHQKFGKYCACGSGDILADKTDAQTDILITILRNRRYVDDSKHGTSFAAHDVIISEY